jgi:class 3 adenylate cyclase
MYVIVRGIGADNGRFRIMATSGLAMVLFTDLVGSTRLRDHLGDDVADEIGVEHDRIFGDALAQPILNRRYVYSARPRLRGYSYS